MNGQWYRKDGDAIVMILHVQPGAKRNEISGFHGDALKLRLAAPPIEGRANQALLKFMAELFQVPLRRVTLLKGEKSHLKIVVVECSRVDPVSIITT